MGATTNGSHYKWEPPQMGATTNGSHYKWEPPQMGATINGSYYNCDKKSTNTENTYKTTAVIFQ